MNARSLPLIAFLMLSCGPALAADWVFISGNAEQGVTLLVDASSIRIKGDIRYVWAKLKQAPHSTRGVGDAANKWVSAMVSRKAFNCAEELGRDEAMNFYYEDRSNETLSSTGYPTPWEPVPP